MALGRAPCCRRGSFVSRGLRVTFGALALTLAIFAMLAGREVFAADPGPAAAPSPRPTVLYNFARTVTVESSGGSIFGNLHSTLTLVQQRTGVAPSVNDARLNALIDALSTDCVPQLTAATLGLTPELMHGLRDDQLQYGGRVSSGQRKWYDATLDQAALDDTLKRYYAYDPTPVDAEYTNVRVSVMDSTGVVLSAEATAHRVLMLPWYISRGKRGTCTSWDPRLSRAVAPYLSGDFADRAMGAALAQTIAREYILHHMAPWNTIYARERFGRQLDHLTPQLTLDSADVCGDGVTTCKDDNFLYIYLRSRTGPANVRFGNDLPIDARWRLTGWDAFLAQIPPASARLRSFGPVAAVLGAPGYDVDVQLPPMTQREGARDGLDGCGGGDLLGSTKPDDALSIFVEQRKQPDDESGRGSWWLILPDGSAVLTSYSGGAPLHLANVPAASPLRYVAALFSPDGTFLKGHACK